MLVGSMRRMLPGVRASAQVFSRATAVRQSMFRRTKPEGRGLPSTATVALASPRSAARPTACTGAPSMA
ncbi:hypothetical protein HK414_11475 [Ramlibacter terrae]|uniref:Uncharacterized protein n=1 Tax=Ramlibacter terrae TaxID=2732511 RepID=A0ABX6P3D2_9BURK|nr:hypothetical protein HK414_11475 [Ramlibacter terrae]